MHFCYVIIAALTDAAGIADVIILLFNQL